MKKRIKPVVNKYIDPLTDFGFKKIFGSEPNKDLLIDFLNGILEGRKHIVDLAYNKNEHPGETVHEGTAIFDLTCAADDGSKFIIEVQRGHPLNFKDRSMFYFSRLITEQAPKGRRAEWGYEIREVYFIALLEDFSLDMRNPGGKSLFNFCFKERETNECLYPLGFEHIFIELVNFVKGEGALHTDLDKWLYVLKNMSKLDKLPVFVRKPIFEKLFNVAEYTNLKKEEKAMYDAYLKRKWDNQAVIDKLILDNTKEAEGKARKAEEKTKKAEEKTKKAEEEAKKAEEEAKKAEEKAKKAEEEAKKAEEEAKKAEEKTKKAEEEAKKAEEEAKKAEEKTKKAEEEAKKAEERTKKAEEEAKKGIIEIARKMKAETLSNAQISKLTKLSIAEIEQL